MILHPGVLSLLLGSVVAFVMMAYATAVATTVTRRWDFTSSSESQLGLERKTYLVSTLIQYALGFEVLSTILFLYTVDDLHVYFAGAMCATGSLNANTVGWNVLWVKTAVAFAAAFWIVLNRLDQRSPDYPLVRTKYAALYAITPAAGVGLYLQLRYFVGLTPEIITSCCGSLFSEGGATLAADLAGLPIKPMMGVFYGTAGLFLAVAAWALRRPVRFLRYVLTGISVAFLFVSLAAIVSFISLYIYEAPSHHCPFDMFQGRYHYIAYPIYTSLFFGVFFGALPGLFQPFKTISSLEEEIVRLEKKWISRGFAWMVVFLVLTSWPVLFGDFTMRGYI